MFQNPKCFIQSAKIVCSKSVSNKKKREESLSSRSGSMKATVLTSVFFYMLLSGNMNSIHQDFKLSKS